MKSLIFIFFQICTALSFGQTPDYFANNPNWHCASWPSGQEYNYVHYIKDTINIGGFDYQEIYIRGEFYPDYTEYYHTYYNSLDSYLRQVGRSIRYYDTQNNIDSLLVNYDLNVGDSLKYNYHYVLAPYNTLAVQKIDSIIVGTEYRRTFHFDTLNTVGLLLIEGIGYQKGDGDVLGHFNSGISDEIGFDYLIFCYGQADSVLWTSSSIFNECDLSVGIVGLDENRLSQITISPNPSSIGYVTVELAQSQNYGYQIYSSAGQLLQDGSIVNQQIPTPIEAGIYILIIQGGGEKYYSKLVVY